MSFTFRRWLSWQNRPATFDRSGLPATIHAPTALRRLADTISGPWTSPSELLHLLPNREWHHQLVTDTQRQYNAAFRAATSPRSGPHASSKSTIWTRVIGGHHYLFWAWPDRLDTYLIPNSDEPPTRLHTYRKDHH